MLERRITKAGWTRVAFGDVVRLSKARVADPAAAGIERVVGLEHIEPGDLRIRHWSEVADGTTFTTLFKPGQVLFGKRRAYQRKVAVADFKGVCSGDIYVLEPANDRLMPELLPFLCQTDAFFYHAVGTSAGSLSPRTNWTSLASFEFLLPPIQEQARVCEALKAANALCSNLGSLRDSIFSLLKSDLSLSLNHGTDPLRKTPELPHNWKFASFGDFIEIKHGYAFDGAFFSEEESESPILLTPANFTTSGNLKIQKSNTKRFTGEIHESYWLGPGDIVVLMTDLTPSAPLLGAPGLVTADHGRILQNQRIGLVKNIAPDHITDEFIYYSFLGPHLRRMIRALSAGSTVSHTSPRDICSLRIPVPPVAEQKILTMRWSQTKLKSESLENRIAQASSLRVEFVGRVLTAEDK